jgi:hypothetical protein
MSSPANPPSPAPLGGSGGPLPYSGLTVGQLLDRVFRLLRARWRLFVGLAAVPGACVLAIYLLEFVFLFISSPVFRRLFRMILLLLTARGHIPAAYYQPLSTFHPHPTLWNWAPFSLLFLALLPVYALYAAASACAVVRANVGAAVTAAQAWAAARKRAGRYTWLLFLLGLVTAGPTYLLMGALFGAFAALARHTAPGAPPPFAFLALMPLFVLLFLGSYVYLMLMFLRYSVAFAVSVFEDMPALASLRRSAALTRGAKGRIFVVLLVVYLAVCVLIMICEIGLLVVTGTGVFVVATAHLTVHSPLMLFLALPAGLLLAFLVLLAMIALPYAGYSTVLGVVYCDQYFRMNGVLPAPAALGEPA